MSVRDATNVPSSSAPDLSGAAAPNVDDAHNNGATQTAKPSTTASFWDQERQFQANQSSRRREIDRVIGDKTIAAASPLDSEGGQQVKNAAGKAGMTVPSKQVLSKVEGAVKDTTQMKSLEGYVRTGLSGEDPSFLTPQGVAKAQTMAADVAQTSGLMSQTTASAFSAGASKSAVGATLGAAATTPASQTAAQGAEASAPSATNISGAAATSPTAGPATDMATGTTSTSSPAWLASSNIAAIIMLACSSSMQEDNKIKQGRLNDMQKFNKISAVISDYITNTLQPAQSALDKKTEGLTKSDEITAARVPVDTWNNVDVNELYKDGNDNFGIQRTVISERLGTQGLSTALGAAQQWAQTTSNNSEQASNRFQAVDNHTNQTFTMLTGFLKAINDSNSAIIRNYA